MNQTMDSRFRGNDRYGRNDGRRENDVSCSNDVIPAEAGISEERTKWTIDAVPDEHPFALRYHEEVCRADWESCARVLADDARRRSLNRGWQER